MATAKAYVLVDKAGKIISRPFGSESGALNASRYKCFEDRFYKVMEIDFNYKADAPDKLDINHGRITE